MKRTLFTEEQRQALCEATGLKWTKVHRELVGGSKGTAYVASHGNQSYEISQGWLDKLHGVCWRVIVNGRVIKPGHRFLRDAKKYVEGRIASYGAV